MVIRTYYFPATVFDLLLLHLKAVTISFCETIIGCKKKDNTKMATVLYAFLSLLTTKYLHRTN